MPPLRFPSVRRLSFQLENAWRNRNSIAPLLSLFLNDDLHPWSVKVLRRFLARGHAASARMCASIDGAGRPIPWYPYSLCDYLDDVDTSSWKVIESGSGNSTLYWSSRCAKVVALEQDESWFRQMSVNLPENVTLLSGEDEASLQKAKTLCPEPDLIVIDGHNRANIVRICVDTFSCSPLYLVDNSDWLPESTRILRGAGFVEIRFKGPGAVNTFNWSSSLFVNSRNLALLSTISEKNLVQGGLPAGDWERENSRPSF